MDKATCPITPAPNPGEFEERDIIIGIFSCSPGPKLVQCLNMIDEFWANREDEKPLLLHIDNAPVKDDTSKALNDFSGLIAAGTLPACINGKMENTFLYHFIKSRLRTRKIPVIPRRIALIGFSAGCNGVGRILRNPYDRSILDFVYACDGCAGSYDYTNNLGGGKDDWTKVMVASFQPWLDYALEAAQAAPDSEVPKKCLVITHSEAAGLPNTKSASTEATALKLISEVENAGNIAGACIVPKPLIGADDSGVDQPDGAWRTYWNTCPTKAGGCPDDVTGKWPVKSYKILGNFIVVGFSVHPNLRPNSPSDCEACHVFQDYWVQRQVWKDVLVPRWEVTCEHWVSAPGEPATPDTVKPEPQGQGDEVPPDDRSSWLDNIPNPFSDISNPFSGFEGDKVRRLTLPAAITNRNLRVLRPSTMNRKTLIKRDPKRIKQVIKRVQLGDTGQEMLLSCGIDGTQANMFSADDLAELKRAQWILPLCVGAAAIVGLALLWRSKQ